MESLILLEVAAAGLSLAKIDALEQVGQLLVRVVVSVRSVLPRWMLLRVSRKKQTISEPI